MSDDVDTVYKLILEGDIEFSDSVDKSANELIKALLHRDPEKRGNYDTIMNSEFIKD